MIQSTRYQEINGIAIKKTENLKLDEPNIEKIIDLILYRDFIIPIYRDSWLGKTEFLVCYKENEYKNNEWKSTYKPVSLIKSIIANPKTDKDIKMIKDILKTYFYDTKTT